VQARRTRLARLLKEHQYLPLAEVCERLQVSEATARRDLAALEAQNAITRTRGGAIADYNQQFPSFRERLEHHAPSKRRIAAAALALCKPGQTLWLDSGTTCYSLAQALADSSVSAVTVVTNNLPAADILADRAGIEVHLSGGQYFRRSSLVVAGKALQGLKAWNFDIAFLSAEGLTSEGVWNSLSAIVTLQRAVVAAAKRFVFCLDASKVGRPAEELLMPLSQVDQVLCDAPGKALRDAKVRLPAKRLIAA